MDAAPAVACADLAKSFGSVCAVDGASLTVRPAEILSLLGPSGCGKTTLLRLVAGLERPDRGVVVLSGRKVAGPGLFVPPERRSVGLVFQDYALFPHLTVAGNVGYGLDRRERRNGERIREVLSLVGLPTLRDRYPHELSGGQQQRTALARALAPRPAIMLLDEPFSNLDATLRDRVRGEVVEILRAAGASTVVVTHDQEEALSLADRVAVMRDGRIVQVDPPDRLYTHPADLFVAAFVGGANLLQAISDGTTVSSPLGVLRVSNVPPPGPATVVLRPESIVLNASGDGNAVVRDTTYYGHDQIVDVALAGGTVIRSRLGPGRRFSRGDRVSVSVLPGDGMAFPRHG